MKDILNYPLAMDWMWNYCIYLGPFIFNGTTYDLGIHINDYGNNDVAYSGAIVHGNNPGDYLSGDLKMFGDRKRDGLYDEVTRRAKACNIIPQDYLKR